MKAFLFFLSLSAFISCSNKGVSRTKYFSSQNEMIPGKLNKENVWVFIMAGQSNMAGRGIVEATDTIPDKRILTINNAGELITAKEPLHFYEPALAGLDCGYSFGKTLLDKIPDNVSVLLIPTAVGGSSITQWLADTTHRNVKLFSNFIEKMGIAKRIGVIKGILWHQGESDANRKDIPGYKEKLELLFSKFRIAAGNSQLPIIIGELGSFSDNNQQNWNLLNSEIHKYAASDKYSKVISTKEMNHKGDHLHFNSEGQREMGKRFAMAYLNFH